MLYFVVSTGLVAHKLEEAAVNVVDLVLDMQQGITDTELASPGDGKAGILEIEKKLLTITPLCKGVFYMLPIQYNDRIFVRYFESGSYTGVFLKVLPLLTLYVPKRCKS